MSRSVRQFMLEWLHWAGIIALGTLLFPIPGVTGRATLAQALLAGVCIVGLSRWLTPGLIMVQLPPDRAVRSADTQQ